MTARRTKRRYAHELYPHPDEWQVRDLATEVPYLYARALGCDVTGTGWIEAEDQERAGRITHLQNARQIALMADALHQGLMGDAAWKWAADLTWDYTGSAVYERAVHYGVEPGRIKPYRCGPDPSHHNHMSSTGDIMGHGIVTTIPVPEDECETCTEPVDVAGRDLDSASDLTRVLDAEALDVPTEEPPAVTE